MKQTVIIMNLVKKFLIMEIKMPYRINKKKGGKFSVTSPHGVKAKKTTFRKAKKMVRLLNAVKYGGWKPNKK